MHLLAWRCLGIGTQSYQITTTYELCTSLLRASVHHPVCARGALSMHDGATGCLALTYCAFVSAHVLTFNYDIRYQKGAPLGGKTFTDDIHPSAITQYTNACIMYAVLTGKTPVGLTNNGGLNQLNHTVLQVKRPSLFPSTPVCEREMWGFMLQRIFPLPLYDNRGGDMAASVRILLTPFPAPLDITIDYLCLSRGRQIKKHTATMVRNATTHASTACHGVCR